MYIYIYIYIYYKITYLFFNSALNLLYLTNIPFILDCTLGLVE